MIKKDAKIKLKVLDWVKEWNKDQIPKFETLEKQKFIGFRKAYFYVCEHFGSSFFDCCEIYADNERVSYYECKI